MWELQTYLQHETVFSIYLTIILRFSIFHFFTEKAGTLFPGVLTIVGNFLLLYYWDLPIQIPS